MDESGMRGFRITPAARLATAFCLLTVVATLHLHSQEGPAPERLASLAELLPPAVTSELASRGKVLKVGSNGQGIAVAPAYKGAQYIASRVGDEKPSLVVEAIYAVRRPRPVDPEAELRSLYGTLLSIHSLEGIEYFSASRNKMWVLYSESWRIDGPQSRKRVPDVLPPPSGGLPQQASYFAHQRDSTFGSNVYSLSYTAFPDGILLEFVNVTGLSYLGIPVMKPEGLKCRLLVIQGEDAIVFYIVNSGNLPDLPFIKERVETSIANRAEALYKWFTSKEQASSRLN